jgi:chemotaxis protein methyltransferase CheR
MSKIYEVNFHKDIIESVRQPLLVLDPDLRVNFANRAYYLHFKCEPKEIEEQLLTKINGNRWDISELIELLLHILPEKTSFDNFEVETTFDHIGKRILLLNARRIYRDDNHTNMILLAIDDITERKSIEIVLHNKIDELENMLILMAGREVRMSELKSVIKKLREQLIDEGLDPNANDQPFDYWNNK